MRRTGTAIWGLFLCAVLAASPAFVEVASDQGNRPVEPAVPTEVEESLVDPNVEERNRSKADKGAPFLSLPVGAPRTHGATLCSRLDVARTVRRDDPRGTLTHGLRAPPA